MLTAGKMAQDLSVLAYKISSDVLRTIVDNFLDAEDNYIEHGTPRNKLAAHSAYRKMKNAWTFHFR